MRNNKNENNSLYLKTKYLLDQKKIIIFDWYVLSISNNVLKSFT
jgi:hypothetical protein